MRHSQLPWVPGKTLELCWNRWKLSPKCNCKGFNGAQWTPGEQNGVLLHRFQLRYSNLSKVTINRPLSRSCHAGFEKRLDGHENCQDGEWSLLCIPLVNNDKRYDSGKDLSYLNFPRDKQKRKRTPSLQCMIYFENIGPTSLVLNPKW